MRTFALLLLLALAGGSLQAQVRTTVQPGAWNNGATWSGGVVPTAANSTSIIVAHNVNVPNAFSVTIDQTTVNQGVTLTIDNGGTVTVADDGTGAADLTLFNNGINFGFLQVSGLLIGGDLSTFSGTGTSNVSFLTNSMYRHNYTLTEGSLPLATWDITSTVEIAGYDFHATLTATAGGNWNQNFGDFKFNCPAMPFNAVLDLAGNLTSIAGDLTLAATNGGPASQGEVIFASGQDPTINIGGNFSAQGASRFHFSSAGSTTVNIGGDFSVTSTNNKGYGFNTAGTCLVDVGGDFFYDAVGGKLYLAQGAGVATLMLDGDFTILNGTFPGNADIQFTGGAQTFSSTTQFTAAVNYTIASSSTLDIGTSVLAGSGSFLLQGKIKVGSTEPTGAIANNTAVGNLRTPLATRTYQAGSRIIYNGIAPQFIGTGHPKTVNVGAEIANPAGVTLAAAVIVGGDLTLTQGILSVSNQTLTLGGNISIGTGSIAVNSTSSLVINGSGAIGNLPLGAGALSIGNLTLNRTAGSAGVVNDMTIGGVLTLTAGDLVFNNQTLTLNGTHTRTAGFLSANGGTSILQVGGSAGLGSALAFSPSGNTVNTLEIVRPGIGNVSLTSTLNVTTAVKLTNGGLVNTGTISLANGVLVTRSLGTLSTNRFSNAPGDSYNLTYANGGYATGIELPDPLDNVDLNDLTFDGGVITNSQNFTVNGTLLFKSGQYQAGLRTITMEGTNWTVNGGSFVPGTGAVVFNGNTTIGGTGTISFNVFTVNSGRTVNMPAGPAGNVNVSSNFTLNAGAIFNDNGGTVTMNGGSSQNISCSGETLTNLTVNKTGSVVTFTSATNLIGLLNIQSVTSVNANGNLTLISTSDAASGNASIGPIPTGAAVNGNVIVQRFMSDEGVINRYISMPTKNTPVSQLQDDFSVTGNFTGTSFPCTGCTLNGASIKYYDETRLGDFTVGYNGFPQAANTEQFVVGRGYLAYMWEASPLHPKIVHLDVTGNINQGTFDYSTPVDLITRTNSGQPQFDDDDGWNLIGNPYPSSIVWSNNAAAWPSKTDIAPTIYITDNSANVFRSWNANTSTGDIPGGRIAAGQSFWVYANTNAATLVINEAAKTSTTGVFFRKSGPVAGSLMVSLTHNRVTDNSFIVTHPDATTDIDADFDAIKPKNPVFDLGILHKTSGKRLAMYAVKDMSGETEIPLNIRTLEPGEFSIGFSNLESLNYSGILYLVDKALGKSVPISNLTNYSFVISDVSQSADRLYISTTAPVFEEKSVIMTDRVQLYPNPARDWFSVRIEGTDVSELTLLSTSGMPVSSLSLTRDGESTFIGQVDIGNLPQGLYLAKVRVDGVMVVKKIIKN